MANLPDFDPDKWGREAREPDGAEAAKVANPAKAGATLATLAGLAAADAATVAGLERLRSMSCPKRADPAEWRRTVDDALRLASDGWASQALALGWTRLDLFGATLEAGADPASVGLAVWLHGRRLLALTAEGAIAGDGPRSRSYFMPSRSSGVRLLWELDGGR